MTSPWHLPDTLIGAALLIDCLMGDPRWMPHPVRLIGAAITRGEDWLRRGEAGPDLWRGLLLVLMVVAGAMGCTWALITGLGQVSRSGATGLAILFAWSTLALRDLSQAAARVKRALGSDDLDAARTGLRDLVGRDTTFLDRREITCAVVESVAENSSDGVIAPLFYLFLGGPVAAIGYKAINTLDSMVGYTNQRYLYFGRAAARLDDLANLLPARLAALGIVAAAAMLERRAAPAWRAMRRDAYRHASPNAGFPEAAMAGALGLELGGPAVYQGELEMRPTLGVSEHPPSVADIGHAQIVLWMQTAIVFVLLAALRALMAQAWSR